MPTTATILLLLIPLPFLAAFSAFFSAAETALFSLTRLERRQMEQKQDLSGIAIATLLAETRGLIITLLVGNTLVNLLYFTLSTLLMLELERSETLGPVMLTITGAASVSALILGCEIAPKLAASRHSMTIARMLAIPLLVVHRAISPVRVALEVVVVTPLTRLLGVREGAQALTTDEMQALLEMSEKRGIIDAGEESLLLQVLSLGTLKVRDLMTPRVDLAAHNLNDPPAKLIELFRQTGYARVPVYRGDLDHIEGVVYGRQVLLKRPATAAELRPLIRQVMFVPEVQKADRTLMHLRKTGTTMAVAVDEYGGTAGLVTLKDVVRHMLGDLLSSDTESARPSVQLVGLGVWRVNADLSVRDWSEAFGTELAPKAIATLGGLMMAKLGRQPRVGDRVTFGNVAVEVETMERRRVGSLTVRLTGDGPTTHGGAA